MRGVMEKCTFVCNGSRKRKSRSRPRGRFRGMTFESRAILTTACAQACPNEAIVFGDIRDPEAGFKK